MSIHMSICAQRAAGNVAPRVSFAIVVGTRDHIHLFQRAQNKMWFSKVNAWSFHTHLSEPMHVRTHTRTHARTHTHRMHACMHACVRMRAHTTRLPTTHSLTHSCTYVHTHTHTRKPIDQPTEQTTNRSTEPCAKQTCTQPYVPAHTNGPHKRTQPHLNAATEAITI